MSEFEQRVEIIPAFDKRHSDPNKNYGIHNAELRFLLIGPAGAIQFVVSTGWYLPHVEEELQHSIHGKPKSWATDIGYHSYKPRWEGHTPMERPCSILNGAKCYYDGSSLMAEPIYNRMIAEGHEAVWEEMRKWYEARLVKDDQ